MKKIYPLTTQEELKEKLDYNKETGQFTWINSTCKRIKNPEKAGSVRSDGYISISINNNPYLAHRLAWLYVYGELPLEILDHVNGIKDDNRISNLRKASHAQNIINSGARSNSKSGVKGVHWDKRRDKWVVEARLGAKKKFLGRFHELALAAAAYENFARLHHGEFYKETRDGGS